MKKQVHLSLSLRIRGWKGFNWEWITMKSSNGVGVQNHYHSIVWSKIQTKKSKRVLDWCIGVSGISNCIPPSTWTWLHNYILEKNKEISHHNEESAETADSCSKFPRNSDRIIYADNRCIKLFNKKEVETWEGNTFFLKTRYIWKRNITPRHEKY